MLNEKVVEHIQKLRGSFISNNNHAHVLADLFLEEDLNCIISEIQWDTHPRHKVILKVEIYP